MIHLNEHDFGSLAIYAIRYTMGRQTYSPGEVRGIVRPHLKELSDKDLYVMIEDCRRQRGREAYGDPVIDKPEWIRWEQELKEERERRRA